MRILSLLLLALAIPAVAQDADLVLTGGRIVTMDADRPEVPALAVKAGRVMAIGSITEMQAHVGESTRVVELEGRLAIPGFIEGHGHFLGIGDAGLQLKLLDVKSWDEVIAQVAGAVAKAEPGEMIRGRGWHQEKWDKRPKPSVDGLPLHHALSAPSLCRSVASAFLRAVSAFYKRQARLAEEPQEVRIYTGAVNVVQRFGSALNLK